VNTKNKFLFLFRHAFAPCVGSEVLLVATYCFILL
jgi:hypothetical protein